jgi:uncharacterized membrane protein
LVTISPLLVEYLLLSVYEKIRNRKSIISGVITAIVIVIVLSFYISTFLSDPLEVARATALRCPGTAKKLSSQSCKYKA